MIFHCTRDCEESVYAILINFVWFYELYLLLWPLVCFKTFFFMVEKGSISESETGTSKTVIKETGSSRRTKRDESPNTSESWAEQVKDWKDTWSLRMLKGIPAMGDGTRGRSLLSDIGFLHICKSQLSASKATASLRKALGKQTSLCLLFGKRIKPRPLLQ